MNLTEPGFGCVRSGRMDEERIIAAAGRSRTWDNIHFTCIDVMLGLLLIVVVTDHNNMLRESEKGGTRWWKSKEMHIFGCISMIIPNIPCFSAKASCFRVSIASQPYPTLQHVSK